MRPLFTLLILTLVMTGCRTIYDPTYAPAGYKYHQEEYKSPPGAEHTTLEEWINKTRKYPDEQPKLQDHQHQAHALHNHIDHAQTQPTYNE